MIVAVNFRIQTIGRHKKYQGFNGIRTRIRYELNKLTLLLTCGFTAQLVEHCTGIAEVTGSNPFEALLFFKLLPSNCLNWKIYCNDHSSLSPTTAVQYEFHIYLTRIIVVRRRRTLPNFVGLLRTLAKALRVFRAFYRAGSYDVTFSLRKGFCLVRHKILSSRTSVLLHFPLQLFKFLSSMLLLQKLVSQNQYLNYIVTK